MGTEHDPTVEPTAPDTAVDPEATELIGPGGEATQIEIPTSAPTAANESEEGAGHQMILDAFQRGWLDRVTASAAIEEVCRHRVTGEDLDLIQWMEENGHLSASRIAALRAVMASGNFVHEETVLELDPTGEAEGIPFGPTRLAELDRSIRSMWNVESADTSAPALPEEFQRYTDLKPLASGGMGQILLATDPKIGRQVAIKILHTERNSNRQALRRFRREVEITGRLEHPNIVPVHDAGRTADGIHFFCMKLVGGESLAEILRRLHTLQGAGTVGHDGTQMLPDFLKMCDAIEFAHSRGVIHRDLKPANIMIGSFGEVLVMDWGLARVEGVSGESEDGGPAGEAPPIDDLESYLASMGSADIGSTIEGTVLGTPVYMPPEQAEGKVREIDSQSDLYTLGAIITRS